MRTKEPPLSSAMVNSPLVAATQPMAANAFKALCSEARLLPSQPWYKLCRRTDRQPQPSCHLQGSVAWSEHTAAAKVSAGNPAQLGSNHGHGRTCTQPGEWGALHPPSLRVKGNS